MSTKKKVSALKPDAEAVKLAEKAKAEIKKNAKKPEPKKEEPKSFPVGSYEATKFVWVGPGKLKREYKKVFVTSSEDLANEPAKKDALFNESMTESFKDGWEFSDAAAIESALKEIEHDLAQGAVDIEYGGTPCKKCTARRLRNLAASMRKLRWLQDKRCEIRRDIDLDKHKMPEILPPFDELNLWEVCNGKWQRREPDVQIESIELSKDQVKDIKKVLEKITGENLSDHGAVVEVK